MRARRGAAAAGALQGRPGLVAVVVRVRLIVVRQAALLYSPLTHTDVRCGGKPIPGVGFARSRFLQLFQGIQLRIWHLSIKADLASSFPRICG